MGTGRSCSRLTPLRRLVSSARPLSTASTVARYEHRAGIVVDEGQLSVARRLDELHQQMRTYGRALEAYSVELEQWRAEVEAEAERVAKAEAARRRRPWAVAQQLAHRARSWLASPSRSLAAPAPLPTSPALSAAERAHPFWSSGLGRSALAEAESSSSSATTSEPAPRAAPQPPLPPAAPRGLFLHGEVGVGKTLLMDCFHAAALEASHVPCLRRVHFNAFMLEVSARLFQLQSAQATASSASAASASSPARASAGAAAAAGSGSRWVLSELVEQLVREPAQALPEQTSELIASIAREIGTGELGSSSGSSGSRSRLAAGCVPLAPELLGRSLIPGVLCFDEVQMMDVADATITTGVLRKLLLAGWVVVATGNRTLDELAASTQQQQHPQTAFASVLLQACDSISVASASGDYREALAGGPSATDCAASYLHPLTAAVDKALDRTFEALAGGRGEPTVVSVLFGRQLHVSSQRAGVALLTFEELCTRPLGAADFVCLADAFHTVVLRGVPVLSSDSRDHARRFITLVDCLYNRNARLICSAAAPLRSLFDTTVGDAQLEMEGLEFESEGGKSAELGTLIGNTHAPISSKPAPARVSADSRKGLQSDARFTGADERFAFRRALSRLLEMQSEQYARGARARAEQLQRQSAARSHDEAACANAA